MCMYVCVGVIYDLPWWRFEEQAGALRRRIKRETQFSQMVVCWEHPKTQSHASFHSVGISTCTHSLQGAVCVWLTVSNSANSVVHMIIFPRCQKKSTKLQHKL